MKVSTPGPTRFLLRLSVAPRARLSASAVSCNPRLGTKVHESPLPCSLFWRRHRHSAASRQQPVVVARLDHAQQNFSKGRSNDNANRDAGSERDGQGGHAGGKNRSRRKRWDLDDDSDYMYGAGSTRVNTQDYLRKPSSFVSVTKPKKPSRGSERKGPAQGSTMVKPKASTRPAVKVGPRKTARERKQAERNTGGAHTQGLGEGDAVQLEILAETPLGYAVAIVDGDTLIKGEYPLEALLYRNEIYSELPTVGNTLDGWVRSIRDDGKLSVTLSAVGQKGRELANAKILKELQAAKNHRIPISDRSSPEDISYYFGISKKKFKEAVGGLLKQKMINMVVGEGKFGGGGYIELTNDGGTELRTKPRSGRIEFSNYQLDELRSFYFDNDSPSDEDLDILEARLDIPKFHLDKWFKGQRAKAERWANEDSGINPRKDLIRRERHASKWEEEDPSKVVYGNMDSLPTLKDLEADEYQNQGGKRNPERSW